mmetsp:Transcript_20355/g.57813  ORF Transcript_20355/g.57813 Transcript_20355/m.57813 type:complete len:593 (-) Transcript_20355:61-1839(-)|eukprot:CAMPEP_0119570896 /NCGR_PEP_ID=MMETSP1352-20130426/43846_1 /TAXON_ID=265584 /ORGANISM="Stauroneis constricta, Strain CCMP1120" /LENGTH=592 /DNA_ID=CAMNT_0007620573 /DNA_START=1169 /DNA_END=2947 /DNA_ORIENTATION=-
MTMEEIVMSNGKTCCAIIDGHNTVNDINSNITTKPTQSQTQPLAKENAMQHQDDDTDIIYTDVTSNTDPIINNNHDSMLQTPSPAKRTVTVNPLPLPSRSSSCSLASIQSMPSFREQNRSRHDSLCFDTPLKTAWVGAEESYYRLDGDDENDSPARTPYPLRRRTRSHDETMMSPLVSDCHRFEACGDDDDSENENVSRDDVPSSHRRLDDVLRDCKSWDDFQTLLMPGEEEASTTRTSGLRNRKKRNLTGRNDDRQRSYARMNSSESTLPDNHDDEDIYTLRQQRLRRRSPRSQRHNRAATSSSSSSTAAGIKSSAAGGGAGSSGATVTTLVTSNARRDRWVIPMEHPFKILWDMMTVILSFANAYATHAAIRDRKFGGMFMIFCDVWFLIDILLNFITERRTAEGKILRDYKSICARYLTSWFAIDALSLFPWEKIYVQPIIDLQQRRNFWTKNFFRSKAVIRVTTHLRGRHFRWFGKVAKRTKSHGVGAYRLLRLIIKYLPKYLLFIRNMKGVVAVRLLRQYNYFRRLIKNMNHREEMKSDNETGSLTEYEELDDISDGSVGEFRQQHQQQPIVDWAFFDDDDDDGVPL